MARPPRRRQTWTIKPNIRVTPYGLQVYTEAGGKYLSQRFSYTNTLTTPEQLLEVYADEIKAWLTLYRDEPRDEEGAAEPRTLNADIPRYLKARAAMPSLKDRTRELQAWIDVFGGDRRTRTLKSLEIQTVRDRWLTVGPKWVIKKGGRVKVDKPLSGVSVNHRLRALSNLFRVLYPHFPNPVRQVPEAKEPAAVPRAVTYAVLHAILAKMSDRTRRRKGEKHKGRRTESLAKVRVAVLIWTGMSPIELQRLRPADIDLEQGFITVTPRRKGEGAPGRVIPLAQVPEGLAAVKRLIALKGLAPFDAGVVRRAFQRAASAAGYQGLTLYTIRHSFVTGVLRATKDFRQAQLLAGHTDPRTTQRYLLAAILPTLEQGMGAMRRQAMGKRSANRAKAVRGHQSG